MASLGLRNVWLLSLLHAATMAALSRKSIAPQQIQEQQGSLFDRERERLIDEISTVRRRGGHGRATDASVQTGV